MASINDLPEPIMLMIFGYLENESMLTAMSVSKNWGSIIAGSSKIMSKFRLKLTPKFFRDKKNLSFFDIIPLKNIDIKNFLKNSSEIPKLLEFLEKVDNSLKNLEFCNIDFDSDFKGVNLHEILKALHVVESINFVECRLQNNIKVLTEIPTLKSVAFHECSDNYYQLFVKQKSLQKVTVERKSWGDDINERAFDEFVKELPNLKHLVMLGHGTSRYFDHGEFPFKLEKLEVFLMTFCWEQEEPRLNFLKQQKESLKELRLIKLPYDFDGDVVLKFIMEEMQLKNFYYGDIPLILNGKKQEVKEFQVQEFQIKSLFEMFRQFPRTPKFTLYLTQTGVNPEMVKNVIDPRTKIFANAKELVIDDVSKSHRLLTLFTGLYKNFRNITKLTIKTNDKALNLVLEETLPELTQLKELTLETEAHFSNERLGIVKAFAPSLQKLCVNSNFLKNVKKFFENDEIEICGI